MTVTMHREGGNLVAISTLDLEIDQSLLGHLNRAAELGLFGEGTADVALYLVRTGLERLVADGILALSNEARPF